MAITRVRSTCRESLRASTSAGVRAGQRQPGFDAALGEGPDHGFRRDVPDQIVARERAAAQPRQGAVEAGGSRSLGRQDFFGGSLWPAVQVDAKFDSGDAVIHGRVELADFPGVAVPTVSASETVRTPVSFSQSASLRRSPGPDGSSYGLPNAIEMYTTRSRPASVVILHNCSTRLRDSPRDILAFARRK